MNKKAPKGKVWQCQACGKFSKDLYGDNADYGWDESCVLKAKLVDSKLTLCCCAETSSRHCPVHRSGE